MSKSYVNIEFKKGKARVSYEGVTVSDLMIALLALEGMIGGMSGLRVSEIREIIDEEKMHTVIKEYDEDEIIDVKTD